MQPNDHHLSSSQPQLTPVHPAGPASQSAFPLPSFSPLRFAPPAPAPPPPQPRRTRRAPFMEVIDAMTHQRRGVLPPGEGVIAASYPELMHAYEGELKAVYTAAEEACTRIIGNTLLPNLAALPAADDANPLTHAVKAAFFTAIHDMQTAGIPRTQRGALPKAAVDKFKDWFELNHDFPYPSDEVKLALSNETGIDIMQISNWFTNHRKRVWKPQQDADEERGDGCEWGAGAAFE